MPALKRILVVEDDPDDEHLILMALDPGAVRCEVEVARDGQQALDLLLGERPLRPDVVLLDLHLPKVDGLEVLRRLRSDPRTRLTPVVILTSSDETKDRQAGYGLGANSYVCKPVDFARFAEAVRRLGFYWVLVNRCAWD